MAREPFEMTRLAISLADPYIGDLLASAPAGARRRALSLAVSLALEACDDGPEIVRVRGIIDAAAVDRPARINELQVISDELDQGAWQLSESVGSNRQRYLDLFRKARAVKSAVHLLENDDLQSVSDGLYEAWFAVDDAEAFRAVIVPVLKG